jgi:Fe-S cluster biosynthesis and repair protein YggX
MHWQCGQQAVTRQQWQQWRRLAAMLRQQRRLAAMVGV